MSKAKFLEVEEIFDGFKHNLTVFEKYIKSIKSIAKTMDEAVRENAVKVVEMFEENMSGFMSALPLMRTICLMIVVADDLSKRKPDA